MNLQNEALKQEKGITPLSVLQEIEPLLKEYFEGEIYIADNAIHILFPYYSPTAKNSALPQAE